MDYTEFDEEKLGKADLENLETYLEELYEPDFDMKVHGTFMIMQLARNPNNLEELITNERLLGALSRVLKEDGKNSMDLVINILYVFYSFSHFSQFHTIITTYQVGGIVMKTIEYEDKRYDEVSKKLQESNKEEAKKIHILLRKQEKLLYVCFHILLNLAEDIDIEIKMTKKNLILYLVKMLGRDNIDLIILVVTFLKKLSIFQENKNEMIAAKIVPKLLVYLNNDNDPLVNVTLKLLLNLSFDVGIREQIASKLPKIVELLGAPFHLESILKLLYQLSTDEKCKSMFHSTGALPMILELVVSYPERYVAKELIALTINLVSNPGNAEIICSNNGFQRLMDRLLKTGDSLLAKAIRNISQHDKLKPQFKNYIPEIMAMMMRIQAPSDNLLIELVGMIANIALRDLSYEKFFKQYDMIDFLYKHLVPGYCEDDLVLEMIIFIGTLCSDDESASYIADSPIIRSLCQVFIDKQDDDEIVLQILYTFYKLLSYEETRKVLLEQQAVINAFVDLLQDNNVWINKMADQVIDIIMDCDMEWRKVLRKKKYINHNEQWLRAIEDEGGIDGDDILMTGGVMIPAVPTTTTTTNVTSNVTSNADVRGWEVDQETSPASSKVSTNAK